MFDKHSLDFFKALIDVPGPSGFEELPRRLWRDEVKAISDARLTDVHGSEIATINGRSSRTTFLLMGHIDQLGLVVRYVDDNGFLYFAPVGGVDPDTYVSQKVRLLGPRGQVNGIIGKVAFHLQNDEDRKCKVRLQDLYVDIGAKSKAEAEQYAPVGTPGAVGEGTVELLNNRIAGRLDNRFGAFVIAEVLRRLWPRRAELFPTVHAAATVQEETSPLFTGATTTAFRLNPTAAIAVDVNHSMDIPGADKRLGGDAAMGKGAILTVGVSTNNKLAAHLQRVAREAKIPLQLELENGRHGTDADAMSIVRTGIPAVSVGNPLRYMHNTVEMADLDDIEAVVNLLTEFLLSIREDLNYMP